MNRLSHWQLFLIFFLPLFIGLHLDNEFYKGIANSLSFAFIISYYFSIGEFLMDFTVLKGKIFFRFNCLYLLLFGMLSNAVNLIGESAILTGVISFYAMIAFFQGVDHLALLLRIRERKEVDNYKQKNEFLLFLMWPIGVWFIQPRINNIR
jgi:hypothetical protein